MKDECMYNDIPTIPKPLHTTPIGKQCTSTKFRRLSENELMSEQLARS